MQEWNCRRQRRKLRQISYDSRENGIGKQNYQQDENESKIVHNN